MPTVEHVTGAKQLRKVEKIWYRTTPGQRLGYTYG